MSKYLKSHFDYDATPEDEQLADALLAHPKKELIIGAVLGESREESYDRQGFTGYQEWEPIGHLLDKPDDIPNPPGDDHGRLFRRKSDKKPCFYISMPYGFGADDFVAVMEYCKRWGFKASIGNCDTWYPGRTVGIKYYVDHDLCPKYVV